MAVKLINNLYLSLSMKIKDIPLQDRPREKLFMLGAKALTDSELLAILISTGTREESAIELAQKISSKSSFLDLSSKSIKELGEFKGIGESKACKILACLELASRLKFQSKKPKVEAPEDITNMLIQRMQNLKQENFVILLLDSRNCLLKTETIFVGTLNETVVHPREIFQKAIKESAAAIIIAHNHPSGDPTPSLEDIKMTKALVKAGKILDMPVIDHIVLGGHTYFSMKKAGII